MFRSAARSANVELEVSSTTPTVRNAIDALASRTDYRDLTQLLLDSQTSDPRPNALIMVSGREINSLNGLETQLLESDVLSLLPVAHGG